MSETKTRRSTKRQLGQYMTPPALARRLLKDVAVTQEMRVLEPSFGDGSFIIPLIEKFFPLYQGTSAERLDCIILIIATTTRPPAQSSMPRRPTLSFGEMMATPFSPIRRPATGICMVLAVSPILVARV